VPRKVSRKRQEADVFTEVQWPELKAQQALQALQDPAERAAAQARAKVLVEQGWGALASWLDSPPSPAELQAQGRHQQAQQALVDVFDQAA